MVKKLVYINKYSSGIFSIPLDLVKKLGWYDGQILTCIINRNNEIILAKEHFKNIVTNKTNFISYVNLRKVKNKNNCKTHRIYLNRNTINILNINQENRLINLIENKGRILINRK